MSENKENIKAISEKMAESTIKWKAIIRNLSNRLREDVKHIIDVQAEAISQRQNVTEEIKEYSVKIYRLSQKLKVLTKARFEFYATSYQVKTNGTEKLKLIESDLSEHQLLINELDEHVNFLRDTSKNLDTINYGIKNKIELENILGGYK